MRMWNKFCLAVSVLTIVQLNAQDDCSDDESPSFCWDYCTKNTNDAIYGFWFPEEPALYRPMAADPREVCYSVGWRFDDQVLDKHVIDVSFGDTLGLYEWHNIWKYGSCLRIEVEGAVWAVFSPCQDTAPLVNADYYVGVPLTYVYGPWSFRLRGYHISSHIGDEFLLMYPEFCRKNPSAEYLDFFASYDLTCDIRFFGGLGWIVRQDETFTCSPFFAAAGMEVFLREFCPIDWWNMIHGAPFFATYFRFSKDFKNHVDATYVLGFEWAKLTVQEKKVRIFIEYHDGYSLEGQFCKLPTNYLSLRASYSF